MLNLDSLTAKVEERIAEQFKEIDRIAHINSRKVLSAFQKYRVSDTMFAGTTGYGYDDVGRDTLDKIYADVFGAEDALVRLQFVNGTHTIACALFGALRPAETLFSVTGAPYDTLQSTIGITGDYPGSLKDFGVNYRQIELLENGEADLDGIVKTIKEDKTISTVLIQRSRGYSTRAALSVSKIGEICKAVHETNENICVIVDNCYGEFVEEYEPTAVGADLIVGSLIKNPGGGLAPTGGYIAGKSEYVEKAAMRLTAPGIGRECGSTMGNNRLLYQGFFNAPHVTAQAVKTAVFCAGLFEELGYNVSPKAEDTRYDIIQTIELQNETNVRKFCKGIQMGAPVDSFVTPEPWDMPGYDCQVIMAAGAFIQGATTELSADAPMREPYLVYLQGGLTYETGRAGILLAARCMNE